LSAALILVPLIFAFTIVFPVASSTLSMLVVLMYLVFAVGFWLPVAKYNKVRKNTLILLGTIAAIIVPVLFAFTQIFPLINSNAFNAMFLLMHFVLASGVILAYSHRAALKKLF
jgi:cation transport ATPase